MRARTGCQDPFKKLDMMVNTCNPRAGEKKQGVP